MMKGALNLVQYLLQMVFSIKNVTMRNTYFSASKGYYKSCKAKKSKSS